MDLYNYIADHNGRFKSMTQALENYAKDREVHITPEMIKIFEALKSNNQIFTCTDNTYKIRQ